MKPKRLDMTPAEYHASRSKRPFRLSHSLAHKLVTTSPAHALVDLTSKDASTKRQDIGSILHELILGKGRGFAVTEGFKTKNGKDSLNWQSAEAKSFKELALASGRIPLFEHELEEYKQISEALEAKIRPLISEQLGMDWDAGVREDPWEWEDDGVICRGMLDWRFEATVIDLKIWDSANPSARKLYDMAVDIQEAAYTSLVEQMDDYAERSRFLILVCEPEPPYAVRLISLGPQFGAIGENRWEEARLKFAQCMASDSWPAYEPLAEIEPELWMLRKHEVSVYPEAVAIGGEEFDAEAWNDNDEW